jgi:hypothetical protein
VRCCPGFRIFFPEERGGDVIVYEKTSSFFGVVPKMLRKIPEMEGGL